MVISYSLSYLTSLSVIISHYAQGLSSISVHKHCHPTKPSKEKRRPEFCLQEKGDCLTCVGPIGDSIM